ncbi:Hemocyte protein-glutamine gamma-glutamyltransferase [Acromyrmex echinatior]|uniref:protein-glutamine gamma-glutamyltransferase n=2 Tax=Acromyrmex echinatior TaxID=103372 RepID=F4WRW8_ACREC|nr:Hemocyte protein-glutamine gamma-glutamyltransferase [Acromyrmex echinatior]
MRLINASKRTRSRPVNRFAGESSNGILRTRSVVHCHDTMSEEPLEIEAVYLYEKENDEAHHTIPVLRRGQTFHMALRFNREYVDETDIVRLLFSFGPNPNVVRGTRGVNTITNREAYLTDLEAWGVRMVGIHGIDLSVEVRSPIDSPVGVWQLNVETTTLGRKKAPNTYSYDKDIYLLFNPWLKEDLVYLEDEQLLDEYILNDVGKIWVGPWGSSRGREWVFGQFDACVLPACQLLLERSGIKAISRGDPVKMVRAISRIINSNDDKGVLTGRWDGEYSDGTAPAAWTGSVPILEQFWETGNEVKYGQCWVFAGVVTTVCRALGIPSRVVSNLVSAHDANASLSVDRYYDLNNEELEYDPNNLMGEDSIWNYHVWNDVWMARPDLPKGYGGWQAIDATPQEQSENFYQCGPASVEAIKEGAVGYNYDVTFMVASVNADLMRWKEDPESDLGYSKIDCNKYHIGRMILTKAPWIFDPNGDKDRQDITSLYKAKEGTEVERLTLYRAVRSTEMAKRFYSLPSPGKEDVEFDLVELERVNIGEPFAVTVNIKNKSDETRTIQAILSAGSVYYTGVKANLVKRASGDFVLQPNATEQLRLTVTLNDYLDKLVEYCIMKLYCIATVKETRQTWADEDDFQVLKPNIDVKIEGDPIVGQPSTITLSFKNPLKKTLTNCQFNYAGPGLSRNKTLTFRDVGPEENVYVEHQLVPQKPGEQKIIATFTSKELVDITGCATVDVLEAE